MGVQDSGRISPKRPFSVRLSSSVEPSSVRFKRPTQAGRPDQTESPKDRPGHRDT